MYEGRPRSCVPNGACEALTPRGAFDPVGTPPVLEHGDMVELGPPFGDITDGGNALAMTMDPNNAAILYVGVEAMTGPSPNTGIWKTEDGGSTWEVFGVADDNDYDCRNTKLTIPINIRVDPLDQKHMYVTQGVRGGTGFWVTWDGGETWMRGRDGDYTAMAVDPCDFCHVLVGSHTGDPVGVLESTDGGYSWIEHPPPDGAGWSGGSYGVSFLSDPKSGQGDSSTWLVHNGQMWRTSDAGENWDNVADIGGIHGFTTLYYASNGDVYSGTGSLPARSTDNGLNWETSGGGLVSNFYYGLSGDGTNIYAMPDGYPPAQPLMFTPEGDGVNWQEFGNAEKIERGMQHPYFDPFSGNLYFVNNMILHGINVATPQ
jgi:hypothetical protein